MLKGNSRIKVTYTAFCITTLPRFCFPKAVRLRVGQLQLPPDTRQISRGTQYAHGVQTLSHSTLSIEPLVVYDSYSAVTIVDPGYGEELVALTHDAGGD